MFDLFRSRARAVRYMLAAILLLVALSMVITLIPGFGTDTQRQDQIVAQIGGEPLTVLEVQQVIQRQIQNHAFPPEMAVSYVPQIINQIITERAAAWQARRLGFDVTKQELADTIQAVLPQLFEGGKFAGKEVYAAYLAQQNLTVPQFESALRRQLLVNKLRDLVLAGVIVTPAQLEKEYKWRNEKAKIEYAVVSPEKYRSEIRVDPEEMNAYYQKNKAFFRIPEKRSFDLVVIDEAEVSKSITVPEAELRRMYEANKESYRTPERVKVRHILLKTTDVPQDKLPAIRAKAEALLKQLKQGADFAELAKKNSEDPGSASKGGDLGYITRGQTVPAFEQAAFSLKPGQISDIITTQYGLHIIQVLDKQEARLKPFDEVKSQLAEERKKQQVYERMQSLADQARAALVKNPQGADQVARELGLAVIKVDKADASAPVPGIGVSRDLADALTLARKGEVTPVVQVQPTKLAVAVVTDIFPSRPADFSEVEDQIRQKLTDDKLKQLVEARAREFFEKAKAPGADFRKLAQSMGLEVKTPPEFTRNGAVEGLGVASFVEEAFTEPPGTVFGPVNTGGAQWFICRVIEQIPADMNKFPAEKENLEKQVKSEMERDRSDLFEAGLLSDLIKEGKVKIYQNVINTLVANYSGR